MVSIVSIYVIELQRLLLVSYPRFAYAAGVAFVSEIVCTDTARHKDGPGLAVVWVFALEYLI